IRVKTDGERKHTGTVRDDLDRQHQRVKPPDRPEELLDIAEAVGAKSMVVVVHERKDRATEWHHDVRSRRLESRDQAQEIAEQDEHAQNGDVAKELLVSVAD